MPSSPNVSAAARRSAHSGVCVRVPWVRQQIRGRPCGVSSTLPKSCPKSVRIAKTLGLPHGVAWLIAFWKETKQPILGVYTQVCLKTGKKQNLVISLAGVLNQTVLGCPQNRTHQFSPPPPRLFSDPGKKGTLFGENHLVSGATPKKKGKKTWCPFPPD